MNRGFIALITLALAGTLAFPSLAAPLTSTDRIAEDVSLSPTDGPNGDYAYLANDELVVDLSEANPSIDGDGVNPDGITGIDDVFRIRYNGSRYASVWITHGSDAVTFRARGRPIQSESNGVTLGPNESVAVGLVVDTTGTNADGLVGTNADGLVDDMTVHARVAEPGDVRTATPTGGASTDSASIQSDDGPSTKYFAPNADERRITVSEVSPDEPVLLDFEALALDRVGGGTLRLERMTVVPTSGSVGVNVEAVDAPAPPNDGRDALAAVRVDTRGSIESAKLRFAASPSYLDAVGASPDSLVVYRREGTTWQRLDLTMVGTRGDRRVFEARTPGFSTIVVGAQTPESVTTPVETSTPTSGETSDAEQSLGTNEAGTSTPTAASIGGSAPQGTADETTPTGVDVTAVPLVGALAVLTAALGAFFLYRRR